MLSRPTTTLTICSPPQPLERRQARAQGHCGIVVIIGDEYLAAGAGIPTRRFRGLVLAARMAGKRTMNSLPWLRV
jgi:hypothetical protein